MNRREFFKTSGSSIVTIALFPAISVIAESTKPIKRSKEYWKQHFRDTTQEANLVDMVKQYPEEQAIEKYCELLIKRHSEETYVQMNKHTDIQIDNLLKKMKACGISNREPTEEELNSLFMDKQNMYVNPEKHTGGIKSKKDIELLNTKSNLP